MAPDRFNDPCVFPGWNEIDGVNNLDLWGVPLFRNPARETGVVVSVNSSWKESHDPKNMQSRASVQLIQLGHPKFEAGYWNGMRQPAFLVPVRLTRRQILAAAVRRYDEIQKALCTSSESDDTVALIKALGGMHPVLGRVLALSLGILSRIGMPVMGGVKVLQVDLQQPLQWLIGLPAVAENVLAPQAVFALACRLMNELASGVAISADIVELEVQRLLRAFGPLAPAGVNTVQLLQAAHELDIPWRHIANNVYQFGWGRRARWLDSSFTDETSIVSASLARDKVACAKVLRDAGLPVPRHRLVISDRQAVEVAQALGYPVVVKPANLDGGRGVMVGVRDADGVMKAFESTRKLSNKILVEQFIEGTDYRLSVCRGEVFSVLMRRPAEVAGDGVSTVEALIAQTNHVRAMNARSHAPGAVQGDKPIAIDDEVIDWLQGQGWSLQSVLPIGLSVRLRGAANWSQGGTIREVLQAAHPDNLELALKAAAALRLDVAGVDLLVPDIARSWKETGGTICEVNGQPQYASVLRCRQLLERLLPQRGRIPVVTFWGLDPTSDLQAEVSCRLQDQGISVLWRSTADECRLALMDFQAHALFWTPQSRPSPLKSLPVDRADLLVELGGGSIACPRILRATAGECWAVGTSADELSGLADRLVAWLTHALHMAKGQ